jgi:hypothetical protein
VRDGPALVEVANAFLHLCSNVQVVSDVFQRAVLGKRVKKRAPSSTSPTDDHGVAIVDLDRLGVDRDPRSVGPRLRLR